MNNTSAQVLSPSVLSQEGTIWLDSSRRDVDNRNTRGLLFSEPRKVLQANCASDIPGLLDALDEEGSQGRYVAGFLAYEAGFVLEPSVFPPPQDGLLGFFGVYDEPLPVGSADADALLEGTSDVQIDHSRFSLERTGYADRIDRIREHIRVGDVYQINFTAPLHFRLEGDAVDLYAAIRQRQRVPYGAFLNLGGTKVLSFSPELFFRIEPSSGEAPKQIITRPMKGTTHRSAASAEDDDLAASLSGDEKNRAENLMIVDLLRNDLSRVSEVGSVTVPELFTIERYETVTQMTSTVKGMLKPGVGLGDVFQALFPCGSVTGAPKIRAMQLIRELERGPRGVYCGAIGYAGPGGDAAFSVPIRTVVLSEGTGGMHDGELGVGSGVVWDSDARSEYDECLLKARFLTDYSG